MSRYGNDDQLQEMAQLSSANPDLFVISGAGVSTESGIPAYRDEQGNWQANAPIMHQDFLCSEQVRKRYWIRSMAGWPHFSRARPSGGHKALCAMESAGYLQFLVTQNVDRLHQQAGSRRVLDLHGRLDRIVCLDCSRVELRCDFQERLEQLNPDYVSLNGSLEPDGDADIRCGDLHDFVIPPCVACTGNYMPEVVFYGGSVPKGTIKKAFAELQQSSALLVVGSSLMTYSVYQFCRAAAQKGLPVLAINKGKTRHDGRFQLKLELNCSEALSQLLRLLTDRK